MKAKKNQFVLNIYLILFLSIFLTINITFLTIRTQKDKLFTHDGVIQTEIALTYLEQGKNPYQQTYFDSDMEEWGDFKNWQGGINPALHHYVYPPGYLLISWPFYKLSKWLFGYYDQRFVHVIFFMLSMVILYKLHNDNKTSTSKPLSTNVRINKSIFLLIFLFACNYIFNSYFLPTSYSFLDIILISFILILTYPKAKKSVFLLLFIFAYNPFFGNYYFFGHNEIVVIFWIILTFYLLKTKKITASSISLAIAVAVKQPSWLFVPLYFFYLFWQKNSSSSLISRIKKVLIETWPFFLVVIIIFIPFIAWDYNAFFDDIFKYINGTADYSYPITGIGISATLYNLKIIKSNSDYFPFWIMQLTVISPLLYFLLKKQKSKNNTRTLLNNYIIFLSIFLFLARFFNESYLSYITTLTCLNLFLVEDI